MTGIDFKEECRKRGLLGGATDSHRVRFVTHYGISAADIQSTLTICEEVLSA
jgi:threonine aldolase